MSEKRGRWTKGKAKTGQSERDQTKTLSKSFTTCLCLLDTFISSKEVWSSRVYTILRIWMEQTLFCYDSQLIHALLEIMMDPCSDTADKMSAHYPCLLHLAEFHGVSPELVGKKEWCIPHTSPHPLTSSAGPHLSWGLHVLLRISVIGFWVLNTKLSFLIVFY